MVKILSREIPLRPLDFLAALLASFQSSPTIAKHEDCQIMIVIGSSTLMMTDQKDVRLWEVD